MRYTLLCNTENTTAISAKVKFLHLVKFKQTTISAVQIFLSIFYESDLCMTSCNKNISNVNEVSRLRTLRCRNFLSRVSKFSSVSKFQNLVRLLASGHLMVTSIDTN